MSRSGWKRYVPVAERRLKAQRKMDQLRKKGEQPQPISLLGKKIAETFWGISWCKHLESFSDYANRLPRGRTYVRNGSVCHLAVSEGRIVAKVMGSELYEIKIKIQKFPDEKWTLLKEKCAGGIGSLIDLLRGQLSGEIMSIVTDRKEGLFPSPQEIDLHCSCPDWAIMCKHVAAVLYGVGARLDREPDLLFVLRGVRHEELIQLDHEVALQTATQEGTDARLAVDDLSEIFGIDLQTSVEPTPAPSRKKKTATTKSPNKKPTATKGSKPRLSAPATTPKTAKKKAATTRKKSPPPQKRASVKRTKA